MSKYQITVCLTYNNSITIDAGNNLAKAKVLLRKKLPEHTPKGNPSKAYLHLTNADISDAIKAYQLTQQGHVYHIKLLTLKTSGVTSYGIYYENYERKSTIYNKKI